MNSNARVKSDIFILPESAVVYKGRCLAGGVDLYFPTAILPMRKLVLSRYSVQDLLLILGVLFRTSLKLNLKLVDVVSHTLLI